MFAVKNLNLETLLTTADFLRALELMDSREHLPFEQRLHINAEMDYHSAVAFLKACKGYNWYVSVKIWAPTIANPESGFELRANVETTRKEALRVLDNLYGTRFKECCKVRFSIHPQSIFVGG